MPKGIKKPKYDLSVSMNGEVFDYKTDNIKKELQKFKPEQVFTEVYITIVKGIGNFTRRFTLPNAKKLFRDEQQLDIFLNNLLF